jgi:Zn-dependent M28 family amino/carboxypeptidase
VFVADYMPSRESLWPEHPSIRAAQFRLASDLRAHPEPVVALTAMAAEPIQRALAAHQAVTVRVAPDIGGRAVVVHNVLGFIEGSDPRRRGDMVVVGAHLDHDGTDDEGRVYRGADDNASGTAAVMADAAAFARAAAHGTRPATAVLFALWNGEEKGELGAERFVEAPEPPRHVIANINLDMVGRHEDVPDPTDWRFRGLPKTDARASANTLHVLGYTLSAELARTIVDANAAIGLTVLEDYDHGAQDLLHRSDHWPFLAHGIPAVFLTTGLHPDYHTPADEVERIDFGKLERVARLAARAAWLTADGPPPHFTHQADK